MRTNKGSDYLDWVKTRQPARFNPAASGVLPCTVADLAGGRVPMMQPTDFGKCDNSADRLH